MSTKKELDGTSWPELFALCPPPPTCLSLGGQTSGLRGGLCEGQGIAGPRLGRGKFGSFLWGCWNGQHTYECRIVLPETHSLRHVDKKLDTHRSMNRSRP